MTFDFDGDNKRITLVPEAGDIVNNTMIFEAIDIYSAWKEWCINDDGLKYTPAFRAIGNDPIGGGVYVGSYFFMQDGWMGVPPSVDNLVIILKGNLYPETAGNMVIDPLPTVNTTLIMQNSSLSQISRVETGSGLTPEQEARLNDTATKQDVIIAQFIN